MPTPARLTVQLVLRAVEERETIPVDPLWQTAERPVGATQTRVDDSGLLWLTRAVTVPAPSELKVIVRAVPTGSMPASSRSCRKTIVAAGTDGAAGDGETDGDGPGDGETLDEGLGEVLCGAEDDNGGWLANAADVGGGFPDPTGKRTTRVVSPRRTASTAPRATVSLCQPRSLIQALFGSRSCFGRVLPLGGRGKG
jgi:hypothetical protein